MSIAVQIESTGGYEVMKIIDRDPPEPGPGDVLVDVAAAGVNFIDTYHRSGLYDLDLPFVLGQEGAGTVVAVGADVTTPTEGDRIAWTGIGSSYAKHAVVPADAAVLVPDDIDLDTAVAATLQGMTAHYLVTDCPPLAAGDRCLVHAAAGGTGRLVVQMAKIRGAEVVATVGSDEKAELARSAGADHVVNYSTTDLVTGVEAAVGREAIDVVYDGVGAAVYDQSIELLRPRGAMVTFGNASGAVPAKPPLHLMGKSLWLTRPKLWDFIATPEARQARADDVFAWIRSGELEIRIGHRLPLAEAAEAHRVLEHRESVGKILLVP